MVARTRKGKVHHEEHPQRAEHFAARRDGTPLHLGPCKQRSKDLVVAAVEAVGHREDARPRALEAELVAALQANMSKDEFIKQLEMQAE